MSQVNEFTSVIDVREFGAQGDGINDDGPKIQAAIAVAYGFGGSKGAAVYLPPGTYMVRTPVQMLEGVSLKGCGDKSIVMLGRDVATESIDAFTVADGVTCGFQNLVVRGPTTPNGFTIRFCVKSGTTGALFLSGVDAENVANATVVMPAGNRFVLEGCTEVAEDYYPVTGGTATLTYDADGLWVGGLWPRRMKGFDDPTSGAGVSAPEGTTYQRYAAGAGQLWLKTGATDTDWTEVLASTPSSPTQFVGAQDGVDLDSLVLGDLGSPIWAARFGETVRIQPQNTVLDDSFESSLFLNVDGAATGLGRLGWIIFIPSAATDTNQVTISIRAALGTGQAPGSFFRVVLYAANESTVIGSMTVTPTASLATYSFTAPVVPNTQYTVSVELDNPPFSTAQMKAIVGDVKVTPNGTLYGSTFSRYDFRPQTIQANAGYAIQSARSYTVSPLSWMGFHTEADTILIEHFRSAAGAGKIYDIGIWVNGRPYTTVAVTQTQLAMGATAVTLPAGQKYVRVYAGTYDNAGTHTAPVMQGSFIRAIYAIGSPLFLENNTLPTRSRRVCFVGDSITCGSDATVPQFGSFIGYTRRYFPGEVMADCYSGRQLYADARNATVQRAFVNKLRFYNPTDIWLALGTNDWGAAAGNDWSAASYGTGLGELLDMARLALPDTVWYLQTPIIRSGQATANTFGDNLQAYRDAMTAAGAARTAFCVNVDAATTLTLADLTDGTHPGDTGFGKMTNLLIRPNLNF